MAESDGDLPSSPDPLGDEFPSSARPSARRITRALPQHDLSMLSVRKSTPRRTSPIRPSPRKQTFELDVGNELAPQKILVTVEAEEALRQGRGVGRRLFPSKSMSPSRSPRRREAATTTTTIPLNDEAEAMVGDTEPPRRRGRPRRVSNGTPMPRKRAATPIQRNSKQRRKSGDHTSEANLLSDVPTEATPKPKTRIRKTPKKASAMTAVPSSQISGKTTGRKRGRPRKALVPEEVAALTEARRENSVIASHANMEQSEPEILDSTEPNTEVPPEANTRGNSQLDFNDEPDAPPSDFPPRASSHTPTPSGISRSPAPLSRDLSVEDNNAAMSDDYQFLEADTDQDSEFEAVDVGTYYGQDNLTRASDFSMVAIESLPSFQANASGMSMPAQEMGDETSLIINQTLKSLRRSAQSSQRQQSPDLLTAGNSTTERDGMVRSSTSSGRTSTRALSRSPRRAKPVSLSRQVFGPKTPQGNDSFSSVADSILQAATPGRKSVESPSSMEPTEGYDDSFSEIPDVVLEAATPKPPTRAARARTEDSSMNSPSVSHRSHAVNRTGSSYLTSSRLPTPDDTSSSNAGSRKAHDDDNAAAPSDICSEMPSSPPLLAQPHDSDYRPVRPDRQSPLSLSSPTRAPKEPSKSPESQVRSRRPTLSPIVRVARTLQNVMSERLSSEGRESSLGSPFRGSVSEQPPTAPPDNSRQPSAVPSPARTAQSAFKDDGQQRTSNVAALLAQGLRSSTRNLRSSSQDITGPLDDPFGPQKHHYPNTELLEEAVNSTDPPLSPKNAIFHSSMTSSTRAAPPSDDGMDWVAGNAENEPRDIQQSGFQRSRSQSSSLFATHGSHMSRTITETEDQVDKETKEDSGVEDERNDGARETVGELLGEGDDLDIWDFEASRPTPKRPNLQPIATQPEVAPSRRSKIPSPWRRTARRLIYQDEFASPSQIEIDESPQSEPGEQQMVLPEQRQSSFQPKELRETLPSLDGTAENLNTDGPQDPDTPQLEVSEEHIEHDVPNSEHFERENQKPTRLQPQQLRLLQPDPADASEYSMVAPQALQREEPPTTEKPTPARSGLLGGFNILSFFSSPATLPKKTPKTKPVDNGTNFPTGTQARSGQPLSQKPLNSIWSTGLFPSIHQKEFCPSPERRVDLFSPAPALPSNDTAADTEAPSSSPPRSPSYSAVQSAAPSTPEKQIFPSIEQKRNFTPRPGRSESSLFTPSRTGHSSRSSTGDGDLLQIPNDELQESSLLTDGSEYERVPPREKPSQWDRHLSPSKSCFRSPLKPTTPGRVVAFAAATPSPLVQVHNRANRRAGNNGGTAAVAEGPLLQPAVYEGKENQPIHSSHQIVNKKRTRTNANISADKPATAPRQQQKAQAETIVPQPLSRTEWTRQHWLLLDEILQLRRKMNPVPFQQLCALPAEDQRRSTAILGQEISASGESLVLEAWHLDVVEAFRWEVGGWDEVVLAKRLFALIVGEEKRRSGEVKGGKGKTVAVAA